MRKDSNQGATQAAKGKEDQVKEGQEYGWGIGLGSKVLEVRTPSWRSDKVSCFRQHWPLGDLANKSAERLLRAPRLAV